MEASISSFLSTINFFQDPKVSVCGNQHMDNQVGHEKATEGLLRCLRKTEQLFPPTRLLDLLSYSLLTELEATGWPRGRGLRGTAQDMCLYPGQSGTSPWQNPNGLTGYPVPARAK